MSAIAKQTILSVRAPKAVGPYSQAVRLGNLIYTAGQIPINPQDSSVVGTDVATQIVQVLQNLTHLLQDAGTSLDNVVKTTMFLKDMNDFAKANEVYGRYFKSPYPARSTIEVARLPKDVLVEIEAIAFVP